MKRDSVSVETFSCHKTCESGGSSTTIPSLRSTSDRQHDILQGYMAHLG